MKVNKALILSAGFGTRMGEIGKTLPKILWPIFDKSLLELQVLYLKEMPHFPEILRFVKLDKVFQIFESKFNYGHVKLTVP